MENLGIDYKLLIAQVVNFGILFFLFSRFIAKPFLNAIKSEKERDIEKDRYLAELEAKHTRMMEEEKEWRKKIKQEQEKILDDTKHAAEKLRVELMERAKNEANDFIDRAKKQIDEDRANFLREVKTHIANMSVFVIEQALRKYLTTDIQKKLTDHILTNIKKN